MRHPVAFYLPLLVCCVACGPDNELELLAAGAAEEPIVGGSAYSSLPAVGALLIDGELACTGTVIGPRRVLTAAHCVDGVRPSRLSFALGTRATAPTTTLDVSSRRLHPDYDPETLQHDLALLTLKSQAPVSPMPLLEHMDEGFIGQALLFVGYGVTSGETQEGAGKKRAVWMEISDIDATSFAYATPGKNTCQGDSGGPALYRQGKRRYRLAGVTSWGDETCTEYGVDTRVDAHLEFLED